MPSRGAARNRWTKTTFGLFLAPSSAVHFMVCLKSRQPGHFLIGGRWTAFVVCFPAVFSATLREREAEYDRAADARRDGRVRPARDPWRNSGDRAYGKGRS